MNSVKRILVVDDNRDLQSAMKMILDMEGYQTFTAGDGAQALDLIHQYHPDLIFLDMYMPGMDGWAFLDEYYRWPGTRVPIVGMSGEISYPSQLPGIDGFMKKPYSAQQMLTIVHHYVDDC